MNGRMELITRARASRKKGAEKADGDEGFTFVETIIVIGIILILSGSVGFMAVKYLERARVATTRTQIQTLEMALQGFSMDCGRIPTPAEGLEALWVRPASLASWNGPYLAQAVPRDAWGNPYRYIVPGENGLPFGIESLGSDGIQGGLGEAADIQSWNMNR